MLPLSEWPAAERAHIQGVFTDIDDTLTHDGAIEPAALRALAALKRAGLAVYAITGRPVGWSLPFVHGTAPWPVDAIVAENGAVALLPGGGRLYLQDAATRAHNTRLSARRACRFVTECIRACLLASAGVVTAITFRPDAAFRPFRRRSPCHPLVM